MDSIKIEIEEMVNRSHQKLKFEFYKEAELIVDEKLEEFKSQMSKFC